jgi:hypothetical protein
MFKKIFFLAALIIIAFLWGCDKGIEPGEEAAEVGFEGTVDFLGEWPAGIKRTHLVVFKEAIKDTSDFFPPNLSFVVDSIPYKSSSYSYNTLENNFLPIFKLNPGSYKYIVVAQSKTEDISLRRRDWYVVGVYCLTTTRQTRQL